jgi:peptide/nickel transport system substrate-binding protein
VPQYDLANFDPIWTTDYAVRHAAAMVWDTLYGFDQKLQPRRQMVEAEEVSADGLTWTFRLRPGLKFHDGEPVLAKDAVASLNRWAARDDLGLMIKQITEHLGSGPMRFVKNEWVPGGRAVFEKFADYLPRQEPASWLAGGKRMLLDRIEWMVIPDPATAAAALQSGIWCRCSRKIVTS